MSFNVKVIAAPSHSTYAVGLLIRNKQALQVLPKFEKAARWVTKKGAERNVPTWPGFTFEVVETAQ